MAVNVKQKEGEQDIPVEVIAQDIRKISEGARKALNSGLKVETIVLLLHDASGVGKPAIRAVLKALPILGARYCDK